MGLDPFPLVVSLTLLCFQLLSVYLTLLVTLAGTAQYPWVLRQSRYCGYCHWVLHGTVGTVGTAQYLQYPRVLQGTVGTVGTAGAKRDSWVLRQYPWVLQGTVGTVGTVRNGYCGYCRCGLQGTA